MAKAPRPYIVTRHDPVEHLDDDLWAVNGDVPDFPRGTGMDRRMSIIRLGVHALVTVDGLAETTGLVRLVPSHGRIVRNDPAGAIRRAVEKAL
jgi:hypothetical protein